MGRGGWKQAVQKVIARGVKEQLPNNETHTPDNNLIQIEFLFSGDETGFCYELRRKPILPGNNTENSRIIFMDKFYMVVTKFTLPKELPVPKLWF